MSNYSIRYNRATNHIAGVGCKTQGTGEEKGGVVAYYAENACGVLTRGRLAQGKSYEDLQGALDAARITGGRKVCKTCEKAALAQIEADRDDFDNGQLPVVEDAEHQVGDELYFIPSKSRTYPAAIPAGKVVVAKVVDHQQATAWAPRFSYVVQIEGVPASTQGTDASELFAPGSVPVDYRFWETYTTAVCGECRQPVAYANTKIVTEPILRDGPTYPGMCTHTSRRVCAHH
jgi:hypothetical protein